MITAQEAAKALDNNQYGGEGSRELFKRMKESGLVAVYGASDDLMEFDGAISDEVGAYGGTTVYLTKSGLLTNDCDNDRCPHFEKMCDAAEDAGAQIEAIWAPDGDKASWAYKTSIPHETFTIMEDDEPYCRGIVFALADVP